MTTTPNIPIDDRLAQLLIAYLQLAKESHDDILNYLGKLPQRNTGSHDAVPATRGVSAILGSQLYNRPHSELDLTQQKRIRRDFALQNMPEPLAWWISCDFVERALTSKSADGPVQSAIRARRDWLLGDIDDEKLNLIIDAVRPMWRDSWAACAVVQASPRSVADHAAVAFDNENLGREVNWQVSRMIETLQAVLVSQQGLQRKTAT